MESGHGKKEGKREDQGKEEIKKKATFISVIGEQNLNRVGKREKRGKNRSKQFDAIFVTRVRRKIPLYRVDTQCIPLIAIIWVGPRPAKIRCAHVPGKLYQFH